MAKMVVLCWIPTKPFSEKGHRVQQRVLIKNERAAINHLQSRLAQPPAPVLTDRVGRLRISSAVELDNCDSFMDVPPSLRHVHSRSGRANSQVKTFSEG